MQLAFAKKLGHFGSVRNQKKMISLGLVLLFILSCTTPRVTEIDPGEQKKKDFIVGVSLVQKFESEFEIRNDALLCTYLDDLAKTLGKNSPALSDQEIRVQLVMNQKDQKDRWINYGIPANFIYLSRSLLRSIRFENELAAALALELAHLEKRDLIVRYEKMGPQTSVFSKGGVIDFSLETRTLALESAMEILYQSGFDPRGMVHLLGKYQENPEKSPYDEFTVKVLMENAWRIIALHAPLRNPIVRSDRFLALFHRMQKL